MLDTLTAQFAPQLGPNAYIQRVLREMTPHRNADGYRLTLRSVPDESNISIAGSGTFESRISVTAPARLYAISASSSEAAGFDLQIRNATSGQPLFGRKMFYRCVSGSVTAGVYPSSPLWFLPKPLVCIEPDHGQLLVQIWNRATVANSVQVVLWFMAPDPTSVLLDSPAQRFLRFEETAYRRAIRGQAVTGDGMTVDLAATKADPMNSPAKNAPFEISALGDNIVIQGVQGQSIAIHQLDLFSDTQQTIRYRDGAGGADLRGPMANYWGGYILPYQDDPHWLLHDGNSFVLNLAEGTPGADTGKLTGFVKYRMF